MFRLNRPEGQPFQHEEFLAIGKALGVDQVWAWGSRCRGNYVPESDWDVLVLISEERDRRWVAREGARVSEQLGIKVDLFLVSHPALFQGAVHITTGVNA